MLPDERVSRAHARLQVRGGETWFTDLNSTNGSLIEGRNRLGTSVLIATHDHQLMRQFKAPRLELHDGNVRIV